MFNYWNKKGLIKYQEVKNILLFFIKSYFQNFIQIHNSIKCLKNCIIAMYEHAAAIAYVGRISINKF